MRMTAIQLSATEEARRRYVGGVLAYFRHLRRQAAGLAALRLHEKPHRVRLMRLKMTRENDGSVVMLTAWAEPLRHAWVKGGGCAACDRRWRDHTLKERTFQQ